MNTFFTRYRAPVVIFLFIVAIFLPRLVGLGKMLTIDEPLWRDRGAVFIQNITALHLSKTLIAGQPGITTAWIVGMTSRFHSLAADQAGIAVITGILVVVITYFLTILWGFRWGMFAGFLIALDPFLLGHSRVVHTDALNGLFYVASIVSLLAGLKPLEEGGKPIMRYIAASGILATLTVLTKVFSGLLIIPIAAIFLFYFWKSKQPLKNSMRIIGLWTSAGVVTLLAALPALWENAPHVYHFLFDRILLHAGGTRSSDVTAHPWFYIREFLFRITPLTSLFLIPGVVALFWKRIPSIATQASLVAFSGIFFAVMMSISADKGARYIMATFIIAVIVSTYGIRWLVQRLSLMHQSIIQGVIILFLSWNALITYPYFITYANQLYPVESSHRIGWGEGLELAAQWIKTQDPNAKVVSTYPRVFSYFWGSQVESDAHVYTSHPDYLVLYRTIFERDKDSQEAGLVQDYILSDKKPVKIIYIHNIPMAWIYKTAEDKT